jgi:hypothetical protein
MYECPKLNRVGDAQQVVLGFAAFGNDLDGSWPGSSQDFADDEDANTAPQS